MATSSEGLARLQRLAQAAEQFPAAKSPSSRTTARKTNSSLPSYSIHSGQRGRLRPSTLFACIGILVVILWGFRNSLLTTYSMHHAPWMDKALHSMESSVHTVQEGVHTMQHALHSRRAMPDKGPSVPAASAARRSRQL
mmetsp:Transcript_36898/g.87690  ORF Transcript_36898/g.87690 Transcript_36898/m.87690 type:complete len:139 (-) Transcript_36898:136-552(-)